MTYQGRSQDDLPLAAYSTGVVADDLEDEAVPEPPHLSQQDAVALAMGIEPAAAPASEEAAAPGAAGSGRSGLSLPRLSLPRPSLSLSLPRLPRFSGRRAAVAAESPFHVTAQPAAPAGYAPTAFAMPVAQAPVARPTSGGVPGRARGADLGGIGTTLRNPRTAVRNPRVLFGGMVAVGAVVLGVSILGGGTGSGGVTPGASASAAPGAGMPTTPGPGTIQVAGDFVAAVDLTGTAVVGKPADGQLVATWADGAGTSVTLTGRVASGTRTTTADLTLAITVMRNGTPVTFTSEAGECTVGMAEKMINITGSFVCPEITSDGGRFTVKLSGTYGT